MHPDFLQVGGEFPDRRTVAHLLFDIKWHVLRSITVAKSLILNYSRSIDFSIPMKDFFEILHWRYAFLLSHCKNGRTNSTIIKNGHHPGENRVRHSDCG